MNTQNKRTINRTYLVVVLDQNTVDEGVEFLAPLLPILEARWRVARDEEECAHRVHVTQGRLGLCHLKGRDACRVKGEG